EVCAPSSGRPEPERTRRLPTAGWSSGSTAPDARRRRRSPESIRAPAAGCASGGLLTPIEADDDRDEFGSLGGGEAQGPRALQRRMFVEAIGVRDLPDQSALRLQQQILFVTVGHAGQRQSLAGAFD